MFSQGSFCRQRNRLARKELERDGIEVSCRYKVEFFGRGGGDGDKDGR